jgi:hypothetical protein
LVEKLLPKVGERGFDIYPFVTLCALDIICGKSEICNLYKETIRTHIVQTLSYLFHNVCELLTDFWMCYSCSII